jgi:hypothetical protein
LPRRRAFAAARLAVAALGVLWLLLVLPWSARADTQLWVMASMTRSLSDQWRVNAEIAPRWERDASDYSRTVMRAQLARVFAGNVAFGVGYEFQNPSAPYVRREHRIWQQVQIQQPAGRWSLSHRARIEQRWLRDIDPLVLRARYQFRASHPIGPSRAWSWLLLDEILYTVRGDDRAYTQGLDRHRLGSGLGRVLSPHLAIEGGYTWQVINRPGPIPVQHDHMILLNVLARY